MSLQYGCVIKPEVLRDKPQNNRTAILKAIGAGDALSDVPNEAFVVAYRYGVPELEAHEQVNLQYFDSEKSARAWRERNTAGGKRLFDYVCGRKEDFTKELEGL